VHERTSIHRLMIKVTSIYVGPRAICGHICMYSFLYDVVKYSMGVLNVSCNAILLCVLLLHVPFKLYLLSLVAHI